MAARIAAHAASMSPSRKGSWSGTSAARNARASAGSEYPRLTSTLAVVSERPSAPASAVTSGRGHGVSLHVPSYMQLTVEPGSDGILRPVSETNYLSGEDFVVEFLGYRFSFNQTDFEQRVNAAAVKLGLVEAGELEEDETDDLVELTAHGRIAEPRSELGDYLVRNWERLAVMGDESLVY